MVRYVLALMLLSMPIAAQNQTATSALLLADHQTIEKGKPFRLGLELTMEDHWHTYWENPGSSGLPTTMDIEPVEGLRIEALQFPMPKRFEDDYNMVTYGYDEKVVLIARAVYEGNASSITLKGKANWLECKEICVPGEADLSLNLQVGTPVPKLQKVFDTYQATIPQSYSEQTPFTYDANFHFQGETWTGTLSLTPKPGHAFDSDSSKAIYWPLGIGKMDAELTDYKVKKSGDQLIFDLTHSSYVDAPPADLSIASIVQVATQTGTHYVRLPLYPNNSANASDALDTAGTTAEKGGLDYSLWLILIIAFFGGMILNLMPCVLPVLSLKIFTIIQDAEMTPGHRIRHAWIVTSGIAVSFAVLSLFFIISKVLGQELGVGFQFQNPYFVIGISALIFVMALSFFGVFHLEPPASNNLYELTQRQGWQGAFFQGALMTLLSTPCTAPLLGTAYAWALSQSSFMIFFTFQIIALGLAAPYLLLCHSPKLMALLPKPGAWMEHFKVTLGFLLMATVVWLFSVLWELTGAAGLLGTMTLMLGLAFAAYIFGQTFFSEKRLRGFVIMAAVIAITGYIGMFRLFDIQNPFLAKQKHEEFLRLSFLSQASDQVSGDVFQALEKRKTTPEEIAWIPYSKANVDYFRNQGRIVFLDFTAAWCLNCKTNEKMFINTKQVRSEIAAKDVVMVKVDYTDRSDEITALLKKYDRAGVPLYLFYPGNMDAIVLPEVINKSLLMGAISEAEQMLSQKTDLN